MSDENPDKNTQSDENSDGDVVDGEVVEDE